MTATQKLPVMRIERFSHGIRVSNFTQWGKAALLDYCRGLAQYGLVRIGHNRFQRQMLRVFVGVTADRSEFRFHANQYEDLRQHLSGYGIPTADIEVIEHPLYEPVRCHFELKDTRPPREHQIPIIEYLVSPPVPGYAPAKVVTLQTGKGKTYLGLQAIHQLGLRTMLVIKGMYVDKWIEDVQNAFHLGKEDLMVVRGANHLKALVQLALTGQLKAKFIICTMKTIFNYLKNFEQFNGQLDDVGVRPEWLYQTLGVGIRLIDEVHQDYHCNFRQDLYSHVPLTISLSATLDSDDPFLNKTYEVNWPRNTRAPEPEYHKFIVAKALWYSINEPHKIRCKNHMKQYSHVKFEQSLMKHPKMLDNYIRMIATIVENSFLSVREPGQKMIIFCATVDLCTKVQRYLQERFKGVKVNRYVSEDDYERLLEADISVSTVLSAGTAVDIPNLRITLMTNALSSKQANIQVLGRTRELKDWPGVTPEFLFLSAREIDKHRDYTAQKQNKLEGKVLSFKELQTNFRI